jgi:hypothetical protein
MRAIAGRLLRFRGVTKEDMVLVEAVYRSHHPREPMNVWFQAQTTTGGSTKSHFRGGSHE